MGKSGDIDGVGGEVMSSYVRIRDGVEVYRRPDRVYGGSGCCVDDVMVEHICSVLRAGGRIRTACRVVGLPYRLFRRWMMEGERIRERMYMDGEVVLTDVEEGYLALYRGVVHELGMSELKGSIVVDRVLSGDMDVRVGHFALGVLGRLSPEDWSVKSGVSVDRGEVGGVMGLVGDGDRSDRTVVDMERMREEKLAERDRVVSERRASGGGDGSE